MSYEEYDGYVHDPECPDCGKRLWRWWQVGIEQFYCIDCQQNLFEREVK